MLRENLTQVYVKVATNSYNIWAQQLKEKEKILERQLSEVNLLKERMIFFFFFSFLFFFLLILVNFYLHYRFQNKSLKSKKQRKKQKILTSKNYNLKDFGQKIIKLTQKIPKNNDTESFLEHLKVLGQILIKNYSKVSSNNSLVKMEMCKKILKKIRYNLNKLLEKVKDKAQRKEIKSLWDQNHKISVFLSLRIRGKKKF
jgi:hypothetical protein